jgi:hypothetical protein
MPYEFYSDVAIKTDLKVSLEMALSELQESEPKMRAQIELTHPDSRSAFILRATHRKILKTISSIENLLGITT